MSKITFALFAGLGAFIAMIFSFASPFPVSQPAHPGEPSLSLSIVDQQGKLVNLRIDQLPVYSEYLESAPDPSDEINRTQYEVLSLSPEGAYVLLKYGCGNKQCETLLVKIDASNVQSLPLPTGIFQENKLSPDHGKAVFRYAYNEGGTVVRHILAAVDLHAMQMIPLKPSASAKAFTDVPTWPIQNYNWVDDTHIRLTTADVQNSDFDTIKKWLSSYSQQMKEVELRLE